MSRPISPRQPRCYSGRKEKSIERSFVKLVKSLSGKAIKIQGVRGWPDRLVALPGNVTVWVELKKPGEKARPHQKRVHQWLRRKGHTVIVFDGTNWPQIFTYLRTRITMALR